MSGVIDEPSQIDRFRLLTLRSALKLEVLGLRRRGPSVYSIVKKEFGFLGSRKSVLRQLNELIDGGNES